MGFGGSSSPSVPEVQKDKASKAAGIRASIHTTPLASQENRGKTLLGQ